MRDLENLDYYGGLQGSTLHISVKNLAELSYLIDLVKQKMQELKDAVHQLECFDLEVAFHTEPIASSNRKETP